MRRTHKFWGAFFIIAGWCVFKEAGDALWKEYGTLLASNAISGYIYADICFLIGIRLFTGIPFFKFSNFRRKEKPHGSRRDS
jgi:hypothetical protein